jgi:hypothetical protein
MGILFHKTGTFKVAAFPQTPPQPVVTETYAGKFTGGVAFHCTVIQLPLLLIIVPPFTVQLNGAQPGLTQYVAVSLGHNIFLQLDVIVGPVPAKTVITTEAVSVQPHLLSPAGPPAPPLPLETVSSTVYVPGVVYKCGGGLHPENPVPSPKFQLQLLAPTDVFVNTIGVLFAQTVVEGATVNAAMGELSKQIFRVIVSLQFPLESVIITCNNPCVPLPHVITLGLPVDNAGVPPTTVQVNVKPGKFGNT